MSTPAEVRIGAPGGFARLGRSANPPGGPETIDMLMGVSTQQDGGGTQLWDGWRSYTSGNLYTYANRTDGGGQKRPLFMAYSKDGPNLGGASPVYATVLEEALTDLDAFYYDGSNPDHTGGTQSSRWGIRLYWSNGNENYDKGALPGNVAGYVESQRALYDACHWETSPGVRRYPDAYAGTNPTQNAEFNGDVAGWLHQAARYCDFVMWSMYPPGRSDTPADPRYDWPSFTEGDRTSRQQGFLIRCFYRTAQARAQARIDTGDPTFQLSICVGEVGIGDDPADNTTRPYYTVRGLVGSMQVLAEQYDMPLPFVCWWDNELTNGPQNILSDEDPATNPSTREAFQNWQTYDPRFGGTFPASWTGNPKPGWKQTGTPI